MSTSSQTDLLNALRAALLGRYAVDRLLGVGGMGSVFLGRDETLDRAVAIKVIAPELATTSAIRERFLQEARTVARLRHPNIVAVYSAGDVNGLLYFAMEYVPGESLRELLDRDRQLDAPRGMAILHDLASALHYAHAQGVVHRDVKPENVLLDRETGHAMLTDFGVARALGGGEGAGDGRLTGTGIVLGSPRYMSPEQIAGERTLDGRSDIYALGLVGYELFAGEPAFGSGTGASVLMKQLTETPPPLIARVDGVDPALSGAIERALEKDPEGRWQSAGEMADVLAEALGSAGLTVSGARQRTGQTAGQRPAMARAAAPRWRRKGPIAAGVAALAVVAVAAWAVTGGGDGPPRGLDPRKSYFVAPFEVQSEDPQLAWLHDGSANMLSINLSQWKDLTVVDYERSLDLLRDAGLEDSRRIGLADARKIARAAGAWTVVMGQVSAIGDSLVVVARLYDVASGRKVDEAQRTAARRADPRPLYDLLARDLLDLIGGPPVPLAIATQTTPSVDAYRSYLEGLRALNRWQLLEAESSFVRATRADSSFALAYYAHALTLGWRKPGDTTQTSLIRRALDNAQQLPARDRDMIAAYGDLTGALRAQRESDSTGENRLFVSAQRRYRELVGRDSLDAEAWYGLADSYWHHRPGGWVHRDALLNRSHSLRAFHRTLALDSTFYLANSHMVDIYREAAVASFPAVLDGDSLLLLPDDSARAAYGQERLAAARRAAGQLAIREARAWTQSAPAPQAYTALATAYVSAGHMDSAVAVLDEAMRRPGTNAARMAFDRAALEARLDPVKARQSVKRALANADRATLKAEAPGDLFVSVLAAGAAATMTGDVRQLKEVISLSAELAPPGMTGPVPVLTALRGYTLGVELAMGQPPDKLMPAMDSMVRSLERLTERDGEFARQQTTGILYAAYLVTRQPRYLEAFRRWHLPQPVNFPELDALAALARGDTAAATRATRSFPSPDSMKQSESFLSPMRWVARAEALAAMGETRRALAMYEVLDPKRFSSWGPLDPGWALYARSFAARGALRELVGDTPGAIQAYERFIALWSEADPTLRGELRAAQAAVARLRDAPAAGIRIDRGA